MADRRLARAPYPSGPASAHEDARLSFEEVAKRWMQATGHTIKASTATRRWTCIKNFKPFFAASRSATSLPGIASAGCPKGRQDRAISTYGQRIECPTAGLGLRGTNPALCWPTLRPTLGARAVPAPIVIPTREQFKKLIATIRKSDGRTDSQQKAKPGADLVELLAYSGCRIAEAGALSSVDADFDASTLTVRGPETGTKNDERRTVPMTDALRPPPPPYAQERNDPQPADTMAPTSKAKTALSTACRRLGYPICLSHHDFRHLFATTCIEAGVDIPTVSRWLGHKDGGVLAMRVYGQSLRQDHSNKIIKRVSFS